MRADKLKDLYNKKVRRRILRYVRQTAAMYGVKLLWDDSDVSVAGTFQYSGTLKSSTINLSRRISYNGRTTEASSDVVIAETSLHELAHMLQAARGDRSFHARVSGKGITEVNGKEIQEVSSEFASGTSYFDRKTRDIVLKHIIQIEREAEEFSILLMNSMGFLRPHTQVVRRSDQSLLWHILLLRYGIDISPCQARTIRKTLLRSGHLSNKQVLTLSKPFLSALDTLVKRDRNMLESRAYSYWKGKLHIRK